MKNLFITATLALIMTSCIIIPPVNGQQKVKIKEGTPLTTQAFEFQNFENATVSGWFDVQFIPSAEEKVEVVCFEPLKEFISVEQDGKNILLQIKGVQVKPEKLQDGQKTSPLARIYFKSISNIRLSGACEGDFTAPYDAMGKDLQVSISGAGEADIKAVNVGTLHVSVSGAGEIEAEGNAERVNANISGAGDAKLKKMKAKTAECHISGAGDMNVYASETVSGSVSGARDIDVYGNPAGRNIRVSGAGSIKYK